MPAGYDLVLVPRMTANDDQALLIAWSKADGEAVGEGELICALEFSKSVVDLPAPRAGFLFHLHAEGTELPVGQPLCVIAATSERPRIEDAPTAASMDFKVTAKARKLIEQHGIDLARFAGIDLVKERHVQDYLERQAAPPAETTEPGELKPLSPIRRRTAMTLTESYKTIPHSYLVHWIAAPALDQRLAEAGGQGEQMVSLSDLVVAATASAAASYRKANATWRTDGTFEHAKVHVGFALNQPSGDLVVPVIRDADQLSLDELVGRIRGLQKKAVRHRLTPEDLSGGTITVTSLTGSGVHQVYPLIVPGQVAIIALADRCTSFGQPAHALTIGFDHRALNGAEAAEFLRAVVSALLTRPN